MATWQDIRKNYEEAYKLFHTSIEVGSKNDNQEWWLKTKTKATRLMWDAFDAMLEQDKIEDQLLCANILSLVYQEHSAFFLPAHNLLDDILESAVKAYDNVPDSQKTEALQKHINQLKIFLKNAKYTNEHTCENNDNVVADTKRLIKGWNELEHGDKLWFHDATILDFHYQDSDKSATLLIEYDEKYLFKISGIVELRVNYDDTICNWADDGYCYKDCFNKWLHFRLGQYYFLCEAVSVEEI